MTDIRCVYLLQNVTADSLQQVCFDLESEHVISYQTLTTDESSSQLFSKISNGADMDSLWVIVAGFLVFCMHTPLCFCAVYHNQQFFVFF